MSKITLSLKIVGILTLSLLLFSCNPIENDSDSSSFIVVESIMGKDISGNDSAVVFSDVNSGLPDFVTATLRSAMLDPDPISGVSQYSDIMLTKYVVTYTRSDGSTTEGSAVPYHFESSLSTLLPVGSSVTLPLMIVTETAKNQAPLAALVGTSDVLECTARIEFYGHDLRNKNVSQVASIQVRFLDFPNL
ncbi:MAG TPA: hypothetical protein PK962_02450 [Candidatus Saccharicenans sp.]|nr:hypothetical protein [Candidatus Saccharicenans sp.]